VRDKSEATATLREELPQSRVSRVSTGRYEGVHRGALLPSGIANAFREMHALLSASSQSWCMNIMEGKNALSSSRHLADF